MDKAELRRIAASHGLTKLTDKHLEQFAKTIENNNRLVAGLPNDLHWTQEPAHVLRLNRTGERGA